MVPNGVNFKKSLISLKFITERAFLQKIFKIQKFDPQTTLTALASKKLNGRMLSCNLSQVSINFKPSTLAKKQVY
jgi:hypothetical protein